jgi:hypothetical protein
MLSSTNSKSTTNRTVSELFDKLTTTEAADRKVNWSDVQQNYRCYINNLKEAVRMNFHLHVAVSAADICLEAVRTET